MPKFKINDKEVEDLTKLINSICQAELGQVHATYLNGKGTKTTETIVLAKELIKNGYKRVAKEEDYE